MSEIRANTVSDAAGTGPATLTGQYAAKVWISVNQTGTQAVLNSFNVASITDQGIGITTVNHSSAMSSDAYSSTATGNPNNFSGSQGGVQSTGNATAGGSKTASRHTFDMRTSGNNFSDKDDVSSVVFGDLA